MSSWPHLPKAPITEALIDIRVRLPADTSIGTLAAFRDAIRNDYPTCRERRRWRGKLHASDKGTLTVEADSEEPDGYLLTSADGRQVVQARLDGFTFSRLKPYQDWERLLDTARSLWAPYRQVVQPTLITRIALRYINRMELPLPLDFKEWILTQPEVAPTLPQGLSGFFVRLNIPFEDPEGFVNLTQAVEPGEYSQHVPLIFDIDAFLPGRFDPDDDSMWDRFGDLQTIKNTVFFGSITDRTRKLYE